ncbi:hypothetical protein [Amycolatopsis sp. NPDC003731]
MRITRAVELTEGTQEELLAELRRLKEGWEHFGNDRLASEAGQAIDALTLGASSVRVGHTVFDVTET